MKLLILRLEAPLMRWGIGARWNRRTTHSVPTKSAIVGLIAASMGIARGNPQVEEISAKLKMGVRADRDGTLLTDLQIVSSNSNPFIDRLCDARYKHRVGEGGLLTYRQYLQDSCFTVILSGESALLQEIEYALSNPVFVPYFGSKSCVPSRPILEALTEDFNSIEDALRRFPISTNNVPPDSGKRYYCEIENKYGDRNRQDEIKINDAREYGFRHVTVKYVGG